MALFNPNDAPPQPALKLQRIAMALDGLRDPRPCMLWLGPGPDYDVKGLIWPEGTLPSIPDGDSIEGPFQPRPPKVKPSAKKPRWVRVVAADNTVIDEFDAEHVDTVLLTEAAFERFMRFMAAYGLDLEAAAGTVRLMAKTSGTHDWWCRTKSSP